MSVLDNPYFLLAMTALFWSGNHIVGRAANGEVPPLMMSAVRWAIGAALLWPFARPHIANDWPTIRAHWKLMLFFGLTGAAAFTALQYIGLQYTVALNVSIMNSLVPVLIMASGAVIFRDRITRRQLTGILISSLGVLAVIAHGELATLLGLSFNGGDLIIVFNMLMFAVYATCLRLRPPMHEMSFLLALAVISTLGTLPFALWEASTGYTMKPTLLTFGVILYVSTLAGIIAYAAWNRGVTLIGAARAGPFLHLVPVYTTIFGGVVLGEHLALYHVAGFAMILVGVWLASGKAHA